MKSKIGRYLAWRVLFFALLGGSVLNLSIPNRSLIASSRAMEITSLPREFTIADLVEDISPYNTSPTETLSALTTVGNWLFFVSCNATDCELWKSDGTRSGTLMVKAGFQSETSDLTAAGGLLFFIAYDNDHGRELWKSDGSPTGTILVKDIYPGPTSSNYYSFSKMVESNGNLFFIANDGVHGRELWMSDGSANGTRMVKEIHPNNGVTDDECIYCFFFLTNVSGVLFLTAYDGVNGYELWKSDGTPEGTEMVKDINPGPEPNIDLNPYVTTMIEANGRLFFIANDGVQGHALWVSDGSQDGTHLVKDINPGSDDSLLFRELTDVDGTLFFLYVGTNPYELWKSDGSEVGTFSVKALGSAEVGPGPEQFTAAGGLLYFVASEDIHGAELWRSDGTPAGTMMVRDIAPGAVYDYPDHMPPSELTAVGDRLFFVAQNDKNGYEVWVSNGTEVGTYLVRDINSEQGSNPHDLTEFNGVLSFFADNGIHGVELWASDGSAANTTMVYANLFDTVFATPHQLTSVNGALYFSIDDGLHGDELWKSDGTADGTHLVKDIYPGNGAEGNYPSHPLSLADLNGTLYFSADDGVHGRELWSSDGTHAGTVLVRDIFTGTGESEPEQLTAVGGTLFFAADDGVHGVELWKSDGSETGTALVKDIFPGTGDQGLNSSNPVELTDVNGTLYFAADDGVHGYELWKSDGSHSGTVLVIDIFPGTDSGYGAPHPYDLTKAGGEVSFFAESESGIGLWKSDGTLAGTVHLYNFIPEYYVPGELTSINDALYFSASDWDLYMVGTELWISDDNGTRLLKNIDPWGNKYGPWSSYPADLTNFNGTLVLSASEGRTLGREVWTSKGTEESTLLLIDIYPGEDYIGLGNSSNPSQFTVLNDRLIFSAEDGIHGYEPWLSDGFSGAVLLKDIHPQHSSNPTELTVVDDVLFFAADDGRHGSELWIYHKVALPYNAYLPIVN